MAGTVEKRGKKKWLPPGSLVHTGKPSASPITVAVMDYDEERLLEKSLPITEEFGKFAAAPTVSWLNVDGVHDQRVVGKLGRDLGLHPLVMEDIMGIGQRPKVEEVEDHLFIVLKMLYREPDRSEVTAEQVSLIVGGNFVVSFQERPGDVFEPVRERIRQSKGRVRQMGADYLAYCLIDAVVDNYFSILEELGERAERLEDEVVGQPTRRTLVEIHRLKSELIFIRRCIMPLREAVGSLSRGGKLVSQETALYFRDVHDHTVRVIDAIEHLRELASGLLDIYLTSLSNRMNEVMKVLTVIATIFIPLTFVAGVYGMNFRHMPELDWPWGYPLALALMLFIALAMLLYFRRKGWL